MPRKSPLQKRINQLTRQKREAAARADRLIREKEGLIARVEGLERKLAKLGASTSNLLELDEGDAFGEVQEEAR